eukprot:symbB.v1.2.018963.t1/scaffold1533.1/size113312/6
MPCLEDFQSYLDKHPIRFNAIVVVIFVPLVAAGTLLRPLITAIVTRQGLVISATFVAIRIVAEWLASLYTFFWYVQTSAISKLEGSEQFSAAGTFYVLGTFAALVLGIATMFVMMLAGEPLLKLFSPPTVDDSSLMVTIGLTAQLIIAIFVPARASISNFTGIGLAQAGSSFLLIIATYLSVFVGLGSAVFIQVGIMSGSGCEDEIVEANATAYRNAGNWTSTEAIFNPETWICSKAESALASTAAAESVCEWLSAILLALITFFIGRRRGYFKENGCSLLMYFKNKEARAIGSEVLRSHAGVAVRSILFNTMEMLSAAVSLGIGVTAAAVFNFFAEIGSFSYSVPNLCAVGAMMIGPRLLGQNRLEEFRQLVNLHRIMAIIFAVAFTLLAYLTSEISITDEFTNEVDSSLFTPVANRVYPAAIALQPFQALTGVYGPLLMAVQGYVAWGIVLAVLFFLFFLPLTILAAVLGQVEILVYAQLAFGILHFIALYYLVHFRYVPALKIEPK